MLNYSYNPLSQVDLFGIARHYYQAGKPFVLLSSGSKSAFSGKCSYLAADPAQVITSGSWDDLDQTAPLFGYLGYEMLRHLESIPNTSPSPIAQTPSWMMIPKTIIMWNHETSEGSLYYLDQKPSLEPIAATQQALAKTSPEIRSTMSKASYLEKATSTIEAIHRGDFFQANLTRKFYGHFESPDNAFARFEALQAINPTPYNAFIFTGDISVLSSSPEQFVQISDKGLVSTRPIKGSIERVKDPEKDYLLQNTLKTSQKDQSENLMIVDLMRNDLSRSCEPGSVTTDQLFSLSSYASIHHLHSTITGQKQANKTALEVVKNMFPPGSMTGAPKPMAMAHCAKLEAYDRGIYSGGIGYLNWQKQSDLSVVIRTLICNEHNWEFQVGGGIVAESDPTREWQETLTKAKDLVQVLGLDLSKDFAF